MTDLRQAAQQVLECIERLNAHGWILADFEDEVYAAITALKAALEQPEQQAEPVSMRMPKVGDKVICLEDESLGEVVSLTAGGSPDITFDDGTRGTYLLREFAELFGYVAPPQQQAEPPQRQWVGLTDEDCKRMSAGDKLVAMWAEAKLKERNT
mgnify:CR=1 FL=1|tara:strand:+ start:111 stop:572 length:462 start_codon:yes stop_codon:yes gene_type:complete